MTWSSGEYLLEKWIWNEFDFDRMGWHDATIHALAFGPGEYELSLDIDYIFQWVHPAEGETFFWCWVAPCTLIFHNVHSLEFTADPFGEPGLSVDVIHRTEPCRPRNAEFIGRDVEWLWTVDCHNGGLAFRSVGFQQYVRRCPVLIQAQSLQLQARGGWSFERTTGEDLERA